MQKAMYPCKVIRITQIDHEGTHSACWAVDEAGIDGGISNFIMPFDGVVKKTYTSDANEVWIESSSKVEYADGTQDYMTMMFAHDNDISDLYVGKTLKQGQTFYQEGTKGKATGNHVHFECGKGKFTGSGWYQDASGAWSILNGKKATDCLWIDDSYTIKNTRGYTFKKVQTHVGTPVLRDENKDQVKVFDTTTSLRARNKPNGDVLGYVNSGIYNLLERAVDGDYEWFRVENNLWFAYSKDWCEFLPKKEVPVEPEPTPTEPTLEELCEKLQQELVAKETVIVELESQINSLESRIASQDEEILKLKEQLINQPTLIFTAPTTDYYAIRLEEGQQLYIN